MPRRRPFTAYGPEWPVIRAQVFDRDGRVCACCGRAQSRRLRLQIHHIVPYARIKTHELDNLTPLCLRDHKVMHLAYNQHVCETPGQFRATFAKVRRSIQEKQAQRRTVRATKRRAGAAGPKPPRPA